MKNTSTSPHPARLIVLCAVLLVATGALFLIKPMEQSIAQSRERADQAAQQARIDERELLDRPRVEAQARRIRAEINGVRLHATLSESNETLLRDLQKTALRNHLTVQSLKPGMSSMPSSTATPPTALTDPLSGAHRDAFDITVHGTYRDFVLFLRDLSRMPTLTQVVSFQLNRSNLEATTPAEPSLDALVHIQTIRLDHTATP
jgi:Tfp pilus assembly protein PilO